MRKGQYNWRHADWSKMRRLIREGMMAVDVDGGDVNGAARRLQEVIKEACEKSVERVERRVKQVRWWSRELGDMRLEVKRKRRRWIRYRMDEDRKMFVKAVIKYKIRMAERRREVWEEELAKMNKEDLFGEAYRVLRGKRSGEVSLTTLRRTDGSWTEGVVETINYILEELLPEG